MKRFGFVALCLYLACSCFQLKAATLHAIIAADIRDADIGHTVQYDVETVHERLQQIAIYADMDLSETLIAGDNFNRGQVVLTIQKMKVEPDDVIIYYHSGHGFRVEQMEEDWPMLYFGPTSYPMRLQFVINLIEAKKPAFSFVLADVCNNVLAMASLKWFWKPTPEKLDEDVLRQGYHKLFRESHGRIVASGSQPGQFSLALVGKGGIFTDSLMESIDETLATEDVSWAKIAQLTQMKTAKLASRYREEQLPNFLLDVNHP